MSSLSQPSALPARSGWTNPPKLRECPSTAALAFFANHSADQWRGRHAFSKGEIFFPDPARASELAREATTAADNGEYSRAIRLADEALHLDYIGALNGDCVLRRAAAYWAANQDGPQRAMLLYHIGVTLQELKLCREAAVTYRAAAYLDPLLCWHLNNSAWMAATAPDPLAHAGPLAVRLAENACANSGWGCWCFIGTFAAALARLGDFRGAQAWQRIALQLAPDDKQSDEAGRLRCFEEGRPYVEHERSPAAGAAPGSPEELARVDVRYLLVKAHELIGLASPVQ